MASISKCINSLRLNIQLFVYTKLCHGHNHRSESERNCFTLLKGVSKTYAICEYMHPELRLPLCIFYLVLRGLDTIEDDMSIPLAAKISLLRGFANVLDIDGWTFQGNRPTEKDRNLMLQFDHVISAFKTLNPRYQVIIKDVADQMCKGMADFWEKGGTNAFHIETLHDYDLYCYDAAVSVGEGISKMLIEADFATTDTIKHSNSVALFFQRVNAIHDVKEDYDDNRQLWPREIWAKYVGTWDDLFKSEHRQSALDCASEMTLDALEHVEGSILYCSSITEKSAFKCTAMTVLKAVILLRLCFRNKALFCHDIAIPKQHMRELKAILVQASRQFYVVVLSHIRCIRQTANTSMSHGVEIAKMCQKIEKQVQNILITH